MDYPCARVSSRVPTKHDGSRQGGVGGQAPADVAAEAVEGGPDRAGIGALLDELAE